METGIKDNRKSHPDPVPHVATVLEGSWLPAFRGLGSGAQLAAPALGQVTPDPRWQLPITFQGTYHSLCQPNRSTHMGKYIYGRILIFNVSERAVQLPSQEKGHFAGWRLMMILFSTLLGF